MVNVLRHAVRNLQQVPPGDLEINVDGLVMTVPRDTVLRARDRARKLRKPQQRVPQAVSSPTCSARSRSPRPGRSTGPGPRGRPLCAGSAVGRAAGPGRARRAVAVPHAAAAGGRAAGRGRCPPRRRPQSFGRRTGRAATPPATLTRGPCRTCPYSTRRPSCSAPTTPRTSGGAGPWDREAPRRGALRPRGPRDHPRGERGFRRLDQPRRSRGRQHAGRLEPRPGPAAHYGRTGLGRPELGLRPRDRGRGAGAVRDGLADGHAPGSRPGR